MEQAIFTSAQTDRAAGYHLVAASPDLSEADRRELAVWGPSHDSLLDLGGDAVSLNFHPLPSGAFCVSRTVPAGWEYSGRGGHRVYTHCLIAPRETLARFANNPFALARAALALGVLEAPAEMPAHLEPLELAGRTGAADLNLLARLAAEITPQHLARLVQAARDSTTLAVGGAVPAEQLIAGLLACLPPEVRTVLSFSTGLKHSSRRPFRVVALPSDPAERRWLAHQPGVTILDLAEPQPPAGMLLDGWSQLIERVFASGEISFLAKQFAKRRTDFTLEDLPALGLQLLEELETSTAQGKATGPSPFSPSVATNSGPDHPADLAPAPADGGLPRAHAAHQRFETARQTAGAVAAQTGPSGCLKADTPQVLEKLEALDDAVFGAIRGQPAALEELKFLWPALRQKLGDPLLAESREQYLRYALSIWEECVEGDALRNPSRAVEALEVLCVLFDEV